MNERVNNPKSKRARDSPKIKEYRYIMFNAVERIIDRINLSCKVADRVFSLYNIKMILNFYRCRM
ncbi:MAG: hypothetical protein K6357_05185 [Elusimicrobiota bacterium]